MNTQYCSQVTIGCIRVLPVNVMVIKDLKQSATEIKKHQHLSFERDHGPSKKYEAI